MSSRRGINCDLRKRLRRDQRLNLQRLEDRLAPAVSIMGPHSRAQWLEITQTGGNNWSAIAQLPPAPQSAVSYLRLNEAMYFSLNDSGLGSMLTSAPRETTPGRTNRDFVVSLPRPDGTYQRFKIWEYSMMEPGLAQQFPDFRTYRGQGIDDPYAIMSLNTTALGFQAQVLSPEGAFYIEPYYHLNTSVYVSYYKSDAHTNHDTVCKFGMIAESPTANVENSGDGGDCGCGRPSGAPTGGNGSMGVSSFVAHASGDGFAVQGGAGKPGGNGGIGLFNSSNGANLRTYRLANAATGEYTAFFGGTVTAGQAAIVNAIDRINLVYESQLSIRLVLVANNTSIVYTNGGTDPYTNGSGGAMLSQNQSTCDSVIGNANYDIGHVFSTGGGGVAGLGVVGVTGQKARGVTGSPSPTGDAFWIDYVAHEMGHQYGANHTFNSTTSSCNGNRSSTHAYEQGSGSTIMAYAGICGSDNLQSNSDPYFHWDSLNAISSYISSGAGVGTPTATGNAIPVPNAGLDYTIPALTPFELTGSATDANGDALTYLWEQADLGPATTITTPDNGSSPLFRSFSPSKSPTRTFPRLSNLLAGTNSPGEVYPGTNRSLNFKMTAFDNKAVGAFAYDAMKLTVVATGAAFKVTSPNTAVSYSGFSQQTITWNVSGTSGGSIAATDVKILLSTDGGNTFPTTLVASTPNDGSELVTIPNTVTTTARIKVQPTNNVFFDISDKNFTITAGSAFKVNSVAPADGSVVSAPFTQLDVTFSGNVLVSSIGVDDLVLSKGTVSKAELQGATTVRYTLAGLTGETSVAVSLPANAVTDTSANGNTAFSANYTVDVGTAAFPAPLTLLAPGGALSYTGSTSGSVNAVGDTDSYTVDLDAGQFVSLYMTANPSLRPEFTITGPGTNQTVSATSDGETIFLQTLKVNTAGLYTIAATGKNNTVGAYTLRADLNSDYEVEPNNSIVFNQEIGGFFGLGGSADRAALRGTTDGGTSDIFAVNLAAGQAMEVGLATLSAGTVTFDLVDDAINVLATGSAGATNFAQTLAYVPIDAGTYYLRLNSATVVDYQVVVVRGAALDREDNNSFATAQNLTGNRAVGSTVGSDEWYQLPVTAGQLLTIVTSTPGDGSGEFVNNLDPVIELYDPSGAKVGSDDNSGIDGRNAKLVQTAADTGNYRVRILGAASTVGDYVFSVDASTSPNNPAKLASVTINDGTAQRSMVTSLKIAFDSAINFVGSASSAFQLKRQSDSQDVTLSAAVDPSNTFVTLTFTGGAVDLAGSLADGRYSLTILANQFAGDGFDGNGDGTAGDNFVEVGAPGTGSNLFRLFGDADGNGTVNTGDFNAFRSAFGGSSFAFDFDGLGGVGTLDFNQFRTRFGSSV